MDDFVLMEVRGLAGAADGRGVPLRDERPDIGVDVPDSCFVGDLVGDYPIGQSARKHSMQFHHLQAYLH